MLSYSSPFAYGTCR